jgi:thiamine biosynthesis lipoprotein ApbE
MSAAVNCLKHIHALQGLGPEAKVESQSQEQQHAGEHAEIQRERIRELLAKRSIREAAEECEIDLNALAKEAGYGK